MTIKTCNYVHPVEILRTQILICVGLSFKQYNLMLKYAVEKIEDRKTLSTPERFFKGKGWAFVEPSSKTSVLWLNKFDLSWDAINNLAHEVYHLIDYYAKYYDFTDEQEFKAYLFEWLFNDIRHQLFLKLNIKEVKTL